MYVYNKILLKNEQKKTRPRDDTAAAENEATGLATHSQRRCDIWDETEDKETYFRSNLLCNVKAERNWCS